MTPHPIRVMCVDDNQLVADALERRIAVEPRFEWSGWLARTEQLLERVMQAQPDVVLVDIDMPGRDPFDAISELAKHSKARVVMFSGYVRRDFIDRAIEAGAWGYISKHDAIEDVLASIEDVAMGRFGLSREVLIEQRRQR